MSRLSVFTLLVLTGQLAACRPGTDQKNPEATSPPATADSVPVGRSAVDHPGPEATAETPVPAAKSDYKISRSQVGPIKIGMPVADLKKAFPDSQVKAVAITLEGEGFKAYEIGQPPGLLVEEKCEPACRVWRIQVKHPAYRTAEGLGIGSTLGEIKQYYPITFLGSGETEIVAVAGGQKITFMLDVSHLPARDVPRLNIQNTPDSVKVLGMLVL